MALKNSFIPGFTNFNHHYLSSSLVLLLVLSVSTGGCGGKTGKDDPSKAKDGKEVVLGDDIEPFSPPTLEELDLGNPEKWDNRPVIDALEELRQEQEILKAQGKYTITAEEATKLKNTSPEINEKIKLAMSRLPESDDEVDWDATFTQHISADVKSTNPLMQSSAIEGEVLGLTTFGLFSFNKSYVAFASKNSVVTWKSSKDRMLDYVIMRDDLVWSDGTPITAHDVEFSFKIIMSSKFPSPTARSGTDELKYVKAYDDRTVVFFHKKALPTNVWNINFSILPKHIYGKSFLDDPTLVDSDTHVQLEKEPISGGPYKVVQKIRGQKIVLQRREDYFMHKGKQVRPKAYFKTIQFKIIQDPNTALLALIGGEIDEMMLTPEQWKYQTIKPEFYENNTKVSAVEWTNFFICWNTKTVFFSDPRVRQAMSYTMDYDELLNNLRLGLDHPCNGIYHPDAPWACKEDLAYYKQDLDKAEELLDAAGWIDSDNDGYRDKVLEVPHPRIPGKTIKKKQRFEFSIQAPTSPNSMAICSLMKDELDRIGIICHVRPMEFTVLVDRCRNNKFQASLGGWGTGVDPFTSENIWHTKTTPKGKMEDKTKGDAKSSSGDKQEKEQKKGDRNYGLYSNPEVDRLLSEGKRELDHDKRMKMYAKIHAILYKDQPYTWLYLRSALFGFNDQLRGYNFSSRGPYTYSPGVESFWKPKKK